MECRQALGNGGVMFVRYHQNIGLQIAVVKVAAGTCIDQ